VCGIERSERWREGEREKEREGKRERERERERTKDGREGVYVSDHVQRKR